MTEHRRPGPDGERGAALVLALITAALITAVAASLVLSTSTDLTITGSYRAAAETSYVVEAGVERALSELGRLPDWGLVLALPPANVVASFDDGTSVVRAPDGRSLPVAALTVGRQTASAAVYGPAEFGADSPVWRLFAHAPIQRVLPPGLIAPPGYILVWVADDGGDGDGDAGRDANGQLLVHGDGYGVSGAHRQIEAAIARAPAGLVRVLSWKDPR